MLIEANLKVHRCKIFAISIATCFVYVVDFVHVPIDYLLHEFSYIRTRSWLVRQ